MLSKGRQALFFVAGVLIAAGGVLALRPRQNSEPPPPTLWLYYARATGAKEVLWARHYTSAGRALGPAIRVGPLGLVQQTEVAASGPRGWQWVTLGSTVAGIEDGRVRLKHPAPKGRQILSITDFRAQLDVVVESADGGGIGIDQWQGSTWVPLLRDLPVGITTLLQGADGSLWAMVAQPDRAWLKELSGGSTRVWTPAIEPQGTAGFDGNQPLVPYARGSNRFGYWDGQLHAFSSVYQAALSVTDTAPLWGIGVRGMIPYVNHQFKNAKAVRWPGPEATTTVVVGEGGPWIAVLDGFSQGNWFNVQTGRFGPAFQIKTPWWAVVRAASLGS